MGDKVKGLIPESNPNRDTPIFMGHGDKDMLVKYEWGQQSAKALEGFGFHVDFRTYQYVERSVTVGMYLADEPSNLDHSADPQEMDDLEEFLKKQLPEEGNVGSAKA
jgi:dienelactone hydrolase